MEYYCPHCKNLIYDDEALLCHFCGESLGRRSSGMMGKLSGGAGKWLLAAVVLVLIIAFLMSLR